MYDVKSSTIRVGNKTINAMRISQFIINANMVPRMTPTEPIIPLMSEYAFRAISSLVIAVCILF